MKLMEIYGARQDLSYEGFKLRQEEEVEYDNDNAKIWHLVTPPGQKEVVLDHSPYEFIDAKTFQQYVEFFKTHGRFPSRRDINSNGPLDSEDLAKLV